MSSISSLIIDFDLTARFTPRADATWGEREEDGEVKERFKWVRQSFLTAVVESESHWLARPILPNLLRAGTDLFA